MKSIAINNLKHAWQFVLDNLDYTMDFAFICQIHKLVGGDSLIRDAGCPRKVPVRMGGTLWVPDMPIESQIKEQLADIQSITSPHREGHRVYAVPYAQANIFRWEQAGGYACGQSSDDFVRLRYT
jgi:hypothetical protein